MKLNKIFLPMAALALVGAMTAGCSSDDLATDTPLLPDAAGGTVTMKTTITLDERASTRALDADGKKTFAAGDQIAVIYQNTSGETVKTESAALTTDDIDATKAQSATFSVSLTNPKANGKVRYIYPAAMAVNTIATDAAIDDAATIDFTNLATQDGKLASLASTLDLGVFDGTMTTQAVLPSTATLENPLTIGAFTINAKGGSNITKLTTKLIIYDGTNTYTVTTGATLSEGLKTIYVAMKPISSSQTIIVKAEDITFTNYVKTVTGKTLVKNDITPVNVTVSAGTPATNVVPSFHLGYFLGADGFVYNKTADAAATGTTAVAVIAYVGSVPNYFDKFLAIALTDCDAAWDNPSYPYKFRWERASTDDASVYPEYPAAEAVKAYAAAHSINIDGTIYDTYAFATSKPYDKVADDINTSSAKRADNEDAADKVLVKGWRMPSVTDWRYIFDGLGRQKAGLTLTAKHYEGSPVYSSNATPTAPSGVMGDMYYYKDGDAEDASSLRAAINAACGNTALKSSYYWSSSECNSINAWCYYFYSGRFFGYARKNSTSFYVRAVFAY